jgi:signal transduction histidine kinase
MMTATRRKVVISAVTTLGLAIIIALNVYYVGDVQREQRTDLQHSTAILADRLSGRIRAMIHAVEGLGAFLTAEPALPDPDVFDRYALEVLRMHPTLRTLQLVNTNGIIVHELPVEGNEAALGLDLKPLADWSFLEEARQSRKTVIGPNPGPLVQGSSGVIIRTPLYRNDLFLGWAQGVYDIEDLLHGTEHELPPRHATQLVASDGQVILGSETIPDTVIGAPIKFNSQMWQLRVGWGTARKRVSPAMLTAIWGGGLFLLAMVLWTLHAGWRKEEEQLQEYAERLKIMHDVDRAILSARSPKEIADAFLDQLKALLPHRYSSVVTFRFDERIGLVLAVKVEGTTKVGPGSKVPLDLFGEINSLKRGTVHKVFDIHDLAPTLPQVHTLEEDGVQAYINIPLIAKDTLIGCLNIGSDTLGDFSSPYITTLHEVSASLAVALYQAQLTESVIQKREQLRSLSVRLGNIEEAQKRRLATELHDQVGQNLTALNLNLSILRNQVLSDSSGKVEARLEDSLKLLEDTSECIRDVMAELRPMVLDHYGLFPALRWLATQFSQRTGLNIEVQGKNLKERLPDGIEINLFRIVQEALNNAAKHSLAKKIVVTLRESTSEVWCAVTDDGVGFEPTELQRGTQTGWGLVTMEERARSVGGRLTVESAPGKGTRISVSLRR